MGCYGSPSKCGRLRDSIRLAALPYHLDYAYSSFDPEWMGQFLVDISLKYDWDREDTKLILIIICEDGARNKVRKAAREATNFPTRRRGRPPKTQSQGSNQVENDYRNVLHQHTKNSKSTPGKPEVICNTFSIYPFSPHETLLCSQSPNRDLRRHRKILRLPALLHMRLRTLLPIPQITHARTRSPLKCYQSRPKAVLIFPTRKLPSCHPLA